MDHTQDFERQGARARIEQGPDAVAVPPALRALTWVGALLVAAAVFVLTLPWQRPHLTAGGDPGLMRLDSTDIVVAVVLVCSGVVVIAVRVAAGVVLRAIAARES